MADMLDERTYWQILRRVLDCTNVAVRKYAQGEYIVHEFENGQRYYCIQSIVFAGYDLGAKGTLVNVRPPQMKVKNLETGEEQNLICFSAGGRPQMSISGVNCIEMPSAEPFCHAVWRWEGKSIFGRNGRYSVTKTGDIIRRMEANEAQILVEKLLQEKQHAWIDAEAERNAFEQKLRARIDRIEKLIEELENYR